MKELKNFLVILTLVVFTACDQSKSVSSENSMEGFSFLSSESAVAAAVDSLSRAIVNPEKALLEKITADELTYGHSSGLIQNKEEFIDDLINGDFDFSAVNTPDQNIYIVGETAIVRHIFSAEATNAGDTIDIRLGNVLVYQKQNGKWKLLARQAFKL
jgi:hypothetical protein